MVIGGGRGARTALGRIATCLMINQSLNKKAPSFSPLEGLFSGAALVIWSNFLESSGALTKRRWRVVICDRVLEQYT
jgi:hypothetical protein